MEKRLRLTTDGRNQMPGNTDRQYATYKSLWFIHVILPALARMQVRRRRSFLAECVDDVSLLQFMHCVFLDIIMTLDPWTEFSSVARSDCGNEV